MSSITDFIRAAVNEKPVSAYDSIDAVLQSKLEDRLDAFKDDVRANVFATEQTELEEEFSPNTLRLAAKVARTFYLKNLATDLEWIAKQRTIKAAAKTLKKSDVDSFIKDAKAMENHVEGGKKTYFNRTLRELERDTKNIDNWKDSALVFDSEPDDPMVISALSRKEDVLRKMIQIANYIAKIKSKKDAE